MVTIWVTLPHRVELSIETFHVSALRGTGSLLSLFLLDLDERTARSLNRPLSPSTLSLFPFPFIWIALLHIIASHHLSFIIIPIHHPHFISLSLLLSIYFHYSLSFVQDADHLLRQETAVFRRETTQCPQIRPTRILFLFHLIGPPRTILQTATRLGFRMCKGIVKVFLLHVRMITAIGLGLGHYHLRLHVVRLLRHRTGLILPYNEKKIGRTLVATTINPTNGDTMIHTPLEIHHLSVDMTNHLPRAEMMTLCPLADQ